MIYVLAFLAAAIAVAALWLLTRPLARGTRVESREEYFQLIGVRDRLLAQLNELDLEERDRNMDRDTAADERARIEAELVGVLKRLAALAPQTQAAAVEDGGTIHSKRRWRIAIVSLVVLVPSVAAGVYMVNVTVPLTRLAQVASVQPPQGGMPLDPRQMVARLEARLQENPNDFAGWIRLGRSYTVLGRFPDSKRAFARAYPLMPRDYKPETPEALLFLGFAANDAGHTKLALQYWNALLAQMPPDAPMTKELRRVMEETTRKGAKKQK
ncbi:MAG TPA: hypothetical protein VJS66_09575 [Burkholderiales bacterium]|nr:hypothetical protein [Burkholderiales bacterium]